MSMVAKSPSSTLAQRKILAIAGTPNCGKTTLFNALTGMRQKVANYPGVTVEKKEGFFGLPHTTLTILDLPGLYSLNPQTPDEQVTEEILTGKSLHTQGPSAILIILDGSSLERSLALASSLLSLGVPTAAVVTMFDEIKARGGRLDVDCLSEQLGIPIVPIVGHRGIGMEELKNLITGWELWPLPQEPAGLSGAASRYAWADAILERCLYKPLGKDSLTARIDHVVLHPILGPIVFLAVMMLLFQSIFTWAQPAMDAITGICGAAGQWAGAFLPDGLLRDVLVHGIFDGVGSVIAFLPQILILFFLLFLLEDVGYMARAAFLMDRIMGWAGLQGKSFIALISSYACAVPGIMATRTIASPQDRLATILVAPWMTCSARLPVYAMLIGAFIPDRQVLGPLSLQGLTLLCLYIAGSISALIAARLLRSSILRGNITPFYMELPPYRFPSLRSIALMMFDRAGIFVRRVGRIILGMSVLICLLLSFPRAPQNPHSSPQETASRQLQYSLAGRLGKAMEPVFRPIGFDWRINVGILGSLISREVVISTLAQIYAVENEKDDSTLRQTLQTGRDPVTGAALMTLPVALSLLAFFVYALQCFSTLAIMRRETNTWRWPIAAFGAMFVTAYAASFIAYHAAKAWGL